MSETEKLVQDFVIDFLETGPEYIDFLEFAEDAYDGDLSELDDELWADMFQQVLTELTNITDRYGDTDGFRR